MCAKCAPTGAAADASRSGGTSGRRSSLFATYGVTLVATTSVRFDVLPLFAWTKNETNVRPAVASPE
jgi:hypothetical protein